MRIARADFRDLLLERRGATMITLVGLTKPAWTGGTKCPYRDAQKLARISAVANWIYANSVNRARMNEGRPINHETGEVEFFEPVRRSWGIRLYVDRRLTPFVVKDRQYGRLSLQDAKTLPIEMLYLECRRLQELQVEYRQGDTVIPTEKAKEWIRPESEGRQGVENKVILRDYALNNILEVRMDNEIYQLV